MRHRPWSSFRPAGGTWIALRKLRSIQATPAWPSGKTPVPSWE